MNGDILELATRIAEARWKGLGTQITVPSGSPLTAVVSYKNVNLPTGSYSLLYVLGNGTINSFSMPGLVDGGVVYVPGSVVATTLPAAGGTKQESLLSYAYEVLANTTLDVLVALGLGTVGKLMRDYGSGSRCSGLKHADFLAFQNKAALVFTAQLVITPSGPPPAAAEITGFQFAKA